MQPAIAHVGLWVRDLERMRAFYTDILGGSCGDLYQNPKTGFRSYFISWGDGARLEIMYRPDTPPPARDGALGYAHIALALGSRGAVDQFIAALRAREVTVASEPRLTGDGSYEAVVLDPEGNRVELTD